MSDPESDVIAAIDALEREPWYATYESAAEAGFRQTDGHNVLSQQQLIPPSAPSWGGDRFTFVGSPSGGFQAILVGPGRWLRRLLLLGVPDFGNAAEVAFLQGDGSDWDIATIPWKYAKRFRNG